MPRRCPLNVSTIVLGSVATTIALLLAAMPAAAQQPQKANRPASLQPWTNKTLSPDERADLAIKQMTLDEKVAMVHGASDRGHLPTWLGGAGYAAGVPRLGIPDVQSTDGRSGVVHAGKRGRYATALPSVLALASSWDLRLAREYGALLGKECRQLGFQILLGGTANLVREPRNGRNFECFGEDPILIGKMIAQELRATQEQGVVANINRYALNDQETGRTVCNVVIDKRTMRETDLLAFEIAIKESGVGTVMGAYNRLNGVYCCENSYLLNDLLKKEWGFKGWVMSDWSGTHSTVQAVLAGFDQEMPADKYLAASLQEAVEKGEVPMARLDDMVHRILRTEFAAGVLDRPLTPFPPMTAVNPFTGAELAERVAEQSIVLLKNAGGQLPLDAARIASIAVIGPHADVGVLSGGGSDQVDPAGGNPVQGSWAGQNYPRGTAPAVWHPSAPLLALRAKAPRAKVEYDSGTDTAAAARLAASSTVAIVFACQHTREGFDLPNLSLPQKQDELIEAVAAANPHTIVVLETGGPVTMPWIDKVSAVLEAWYPGIRGAEAIANILAGDVNPSAKLPVTFPRSEADLPEARLPGSNVAADAKGPKSVPAFDIEYAEGLKVGYKWYDAQGHEPLFPFGHGLSYTAYSYSDLKTTVGKQLQVSFTVANTGKHAGAEIAQVYAGLPPAAGEPPKRLVAWEKIELAPGESKTVTLSIDRLHLSVFSAEKDQWQVLAGDYTVIVGGSSRNTPLHKALRLTDRN